jgi:hypothetical protein
MTWLSVVLPRAGRPEDQHMIQCTTAFSGRLDINRQLLAHRLLAEVFGEPFRTDGGLERLVVELGGCGDDAVSVMRELWQVMANAAR